MGIWNLESFKASTVNHRSKDATVNILTSASARPAAASKSCKYF